MSAPTEVLREAYERGGDEGAMQAGAEHGMTRHAVRMRITKHGIHAPRPQRHWRLHDKERLKTLWNGGMPARQIAILLNRTPWSVTFQAEQMPGCVSRKKRPWTPAHQRMVDESLEQIIQHLSERLQRTPGAIAYRVQRSLLSRSVRLKAKRIFDLGGMATNAKARGAA